MAYEVSTDISTHSKESTSGSAPLPAFLWKLWLYSNYDCNLKCSYCVAKSGPKAPRRALGLANVQRLVDEAADLGFSEIFFTGGEPFILDEIYDMLAYSARRIRTTVLTNAMLLRGERLKKLVALAGEVPAETFIVQVSLHAVGADHSRPGGDAQITAVGGAARPCQEVAFCHYLFGVDLYSSYLSIKFWHPTHLEGGLTSYQIRLIRRIYFLIIQIKTSLLRIAYQDLR